MCGLGLGEWAWQTFKGRFSAWRRGVVLSVLEVLEGNRLGNNQGWQETKSLCVLVGKKLSPRMNFRAFCDLHDEGISMAGCGLWHKMDQKLVATENGRSVYNMK